MNQLPFTCNYAGCSLEQAIPFPNQNCHAMEARQTVTQYRYIAHGRAVATFVVFRNITNESLTNDGMNN
jgi:hypothetical protein